MGGPWAPWGGHGTPRARCQARTGCQACTQCRTWAQGPAKGAPHGLPKGATWNPLDPKGAQGPAMGCFPRLAGSGTTDRQALAKLTDRLWHN